jgi:hypothetical protein
MGPNADWPSLLREYEGALEEFDRSSKALTAALVGRAVAGQEFDALVAAEAKANEVVRLVRVRLINLWRDTQTHLRQPDGDVAPA